MIPSAREYVDGVISGEIVTGKLTRLAVERTVADHAREGWMWRYDPESAQRIVDWCENMKMTTGKWQGQPLKLSPWQAWALSEIFGWRHRENGRRRFRYAYLEVARKSGKTEVLAAVGLYGLCADNEKASFVAIAASTLLQAKIPFERADMMVSQSPDLRSTFSLKQKQAHNEIIELETAGKIKPLSSDKSGSQDGHSVSMAIIDELHAHKTRAMFSAMETATGSRENPLILSITTAGDDNAGVCWEQRQTVVDIVSGKIENDRYFGCIWTVDDGDEWNDESVWIKANPNLGVSVSLDDLQAKAANAVSAASSRDAFKTKHLNTWIHGTSCWLDPAAWTRCASKIEWQEVFEADDVYIGMDLASKRDTTALCYLFRSEGLWKAKWRIYIPEDSVPENTHRDALFGWIDQGWVVATPGGRLDEDFIYEQILEDAEQMNVTQIGYDPWQAHQLVIRLSDALGDESVIKVPQTAQNLSASSKSLEADVIIGARGEGGFRHDGNPAAAWAAGNAQVRQIAGKDEIRIEKDRTKPDRKIDALAALINCYRLGENQDEVVPLFQSIDIQTGELVSVG